MVGTLTNLALPIGQDDASHGKKVGHIKGHRTNLAVIGQDALNWTMVGHTKGNKIALSVGQNDASIWTLVGHAKGQPDKFGFVCWPR